MNAPVRSITESSATTFARRHIGPSPSDISAMLRVVGASSLDALVDETIPASIRERTPLSIGEALSETQALQRLRQIASKNKVFTSLIGQGYYGTITPPVILRNILENPAWYTAYTPYQPEISQGRLEAILNFQTMIADLTGLDIANASLLDEATAAAEAMSIAARNCTEDRRRFFVDKNIHPQTLAVLKTRADPLGWTLMVGDWETDLNAQEIFGAIFQYPDTYGAIRDPRKAIAAIKATGGTSIVAADLLALTLLTPPGEFGADIAIGSAQRFGVPPGYGGPHAAYIACKDALKRALPGRLVGVSIDSRGNAAYRLTLQTREQHIRREKATSNICTAQVLLAVIASMYAVYHGPYGLTWIARKLHRKTAVLAAGLSRQGFEPEHSHFFDTLVIHVGARQQSILGAARALKINFRVIGKDRVGIALDETTTESTIEDIWQAFGDRLKYERVLADVVDALPEALVRTSDFLTHPVFHRYHSETELLRYIRKLADRDLALDRAMIPLGSCTMKLNATTEMIPITWPEFAQIHPFAPVEQAKGYSELIDTLCSWLCEITGYDAVSLQPNSGAQGEYAGLLAIRAFHRANGERHRNICLIPASAHGTNPASARIANMEVVVVACDTQGNVDMADLQLKAEQYSNNLAAAMVTYPSTHGVFEKEIRSLCELIHRHGGQVYLDGANLNAQIGLCKPGEFGADVSHLNLHKTFCIPHGGGGPGVGPIAVKSHLARFLPRHPALDDGKAMVGPVAAAPYGSAGILPISYLYILMMGGEGLSQATKVAILSANYIAKRLDPHFPVLYKNENGRVAHECIIDPRRFKDGLGVTVDDIAKRLIDFGFHAPTMSFPVIGTLMIEPTESESKREVDRFVDAMIAIRKEISDIEKGRFRRDQSPLGQAPHTVLDIADESWDRPYTRAEGCFPERQSAKDKYWSPVNRVDNVYGDRNVVCSCPPLSEYE
jgi:glycine dehydrogenase